VTLTATWTRYAVSFAIPSAAGKTVGTNGDDGTDLAFFFSSGATNNTVAGGIGVQSGIIQLWGVQLEVGTQATPLEKLDPRLDLANCQRFYEAITITPDYANAPTGITVMYRPYRFVTTKRASPTVTTAGFQYFSGGTGTAFTPTVGGVTPDMASINGTSLTNANGFSSGQIFASADL
jgi:hypothetical protein